MTYIAVAQALESAQASCFEALTMTFSNFSINIDTTHYPGPIVTECRTEWSCRSKVAAVW